MDVKFNINSSLLQREEMLKNDELTNSTSLTTLPPSRNFKTHTLNSPNVELKSQLKGSRSIPTSPPGILPPRQQKSNTLHLPKAIVSEEEESKGPKLRRSSIVRIKRE
mmetsp:Transcript_30585/g.46906  ORF Transcript_30585/g.46906 Transcript_30585/m.46906 type:complete len:108 (+) Transcript_30585:491-814(+)